MRVVLTNARIEGIVSVEGRFSRFQFEIVLESCQLFLYSTDKKLEMHCKILGNCNLLWKHQPTYIFTNHNTYGYLNVFSSKTLLVPHSIVGIMT